jgi:hypothetical protein
MCLSLGGSQEPGRIDPGRGQMDPGDREDGPRSHPEIGVCVCCVFHLCWVTLGRPGAMSSCASGNHGSEYRSVPARLLRSLRSFVAHSSLSGRERAVQTLHSPAPFLDSHSDGIIADYYRVSTSVVTCRVPRRRKCLQGKGYRRGAVRAGSRIKNCSESKRIS